MQPTEVTDHVVPKTRIIIGFYTMSYPTHPFIQVTHPQHIYDHLIDALNLSINLEIVGYIEMLTSYPMASANFVRMLIKILYPCLILLS